MVITQVIKLWWLPTVIFLMVWFILTKGDMGSWIVGLPAVVFAIYSYRLLRTTPGYVLKPYAAMTFVGWFLWQSFRGGVDVAWRAVQPQLALKAGYVSYRTSLPQGTPRGFLINCANLLPGTIIVDNNDQVLTIHALDIDTNVADSIAALERQVEALFGLRRDTGD